MLWCWMISKLFQASGWDNSGDWGEPVEQEIKSTMKPNKAQKQDSWGEFEDWLSEEKTGSKKE